MAALPDLLIAVGVGSILLAAMGYLSLYSGRSFSALGNYEDMAVRSRQAMDLIGFQLSQASAVINFQPDPPVKSLTVTSSVPPGSTATLTFDSQARTLTLTTAAGDRVLLKQCDSWDAKLFKQAVWVGPTNILTCAATNFCDCKLIKMTWQCSRTNQGKLVNTESEQRMQIVLRNKGL